MRYPVVLHKDADTDYGVTVPDLLGCFSAGDTVDNALIEVIEAIECHIEGLLLDGETRSGLITQATIEFISTRSSTKNL